MLSYSIPSASRVLTLRIVFKRLKNASLTLNLNKCEHGMAVTHLGHQVGHGQARPVDDKIRAISSYTVPCTRPELRRFHEIAGL